MTISTQQWEAVLKRLSELEARMARLVVDGADNKIHYAQEIINVPAGNLSSTDVQGALNELDGRVAAGMYVEDLTSQIDGSTNHFTLSYVAQAKVIVFCNLQQQPTSIIMDNDMRGFQLTYVPTVKDKLVVVYPV